MPQLGIAGIAANANPRDVGEMAADLILKCPDGVAALARFADRLACAGLIAQSVAETLKAPAEPKPRRPFRIQE